MAKPHHDIRPPSRQADQRGQLRAKAWNLYRLVHEGVLQSKRGCLKREALTRLPDCHPMRRPFPGPGEHGEPGRGPDLAGLGLVFRSCGREPVERVWA